MDKTGRKRMETHGCVTKKGEHRMHFKKIFVLIALILVIGLFGCGAEKKAEAPKQEQITKVFGSTEGGGQRAGLFCGAY